MTEIKSVKNIYFLKRKDEELSKIPYAEKFVRDNDNYDGYDFISEEHELAKEICFKKSAGVKYLCKLLYSQGIMRLFSKKHIKSYLGVIENEDQE